MLHKLTAKLIACVYDRKGISAMEYGILAAAIIGVVATAMSTIGGDLTLLMNKVETALTNAIG
jgi:Flp pilus assembly pilin Flp